MFLLNIEVEEKISQAFPVNLVFRLCFVRWPSRFPLSTLRRTASNSLNREHSMPSRWKIRPIPSTANTEVHIKSIYQGTVES